jgi:membrane protein
MVMRLAQAGRWLAHLGPVRLLAAYFQSNASYYATGLAFHVLLSMFPLVLGLLSLIGYAGRSAELGHEIQRVIVQSFPAEVQAAVTSTLASLQRSAGALGILAIAGLLWTGTGLFAHLEFALNRIYLCSERSFWRQRLVALPILASFIAAIFIAILVSWGTQFIAGAALASFLLGWMVLTVLLYLIYWVVPNRKVSFGESWPGALVAGLLIEALSLVFPLYLRLTHEVNALGRGFGLFFVLATWLYAVAQAIFLGAVFNRMQLGRIPNIGRSFEI